MTIRSLLVLRSTYGKCALRKRDCVRSLTFIYIFRATVFSIILSRSLSHQLSHQCVLIVIMLVEIEGNYVVSHYRIVLYLCKIFITLSFYC